jgi:hypothetical protein
MGWILDVIGYLFIGFVCVIIAHFGFGIPISDGNGKLIFSLGFFGWAFIDLVNTHIGSGNSVLVFIFSLLIVISVGYFFVLPSISTNEDDTSDTPISTGSSLTNNAYSRVTQTTTTPIEYYRRTYHWTYGRHSPTYTIGIPKPLYEYYRQQPHDRRNYAQYAISDKDRKVLDSIISDFKENTDSKTEAAYNVVAFVQSLPYFKDVASTGYDEYPRYPIETLVDNGGDCEDTAILTAALLKEMNYDVVLLNPPKHMAVGITCPTCSGASFTHNGKKYYYLETTANNWKVGQMPSKYNGEKVFVYPM